MTADLRGVFESLAPALLRYLRRLTGSRSDAEEILQDTFLKLHVACSHGTEFENMRAWVFRVATNAARDLDRERRVRARASRVEKRPNVVDFEEGLQRRHLTRAVLRGLPRRMRQVLLLWSEGFSYREMAEITGVEPGYVGVLLQRARAAFKKDFEQREGRDPVARRGDGLL